MKKISALMVLVPILLALPACTSSSGQQSTRTVAEAVNALEKLGNCERVDATYSSAYSSTEVLCMRDGGVLTWLVIYDSEQAKQEQLKGWECDPEKFDLDSSWLIGTNWSLTFAERNLQGMGSNIEEFSNEFGGQEVKYSSICS